MHDFPISSETPRFFPLILHCSKNTLKIFQARTYTKRERERESVEGKRISNLSAESCFLSPFLFFFIYSRPHCKQMSPSCPDPSIRSSIASTNQQQAWKIYSTNFLLLHPKKTKYIQTCVLALSFVQSNESALVSGISEGVFLPSSNKACHS